MQEGDHVLEHGTPGTVIVTALVADEPAVRGGRGEPLAMREGNGAVARAVLHEHRTAEGAHCALVVEGVAHQKGREQVAARVGAHAGEARAQHERREQPNATIRWGSTSSVSDQSRSYAASAAAVTEDSVAIPVERP